MRLENPKKHWKEGAKRNIWITYYKCRMISIKTCETCHGAFFELRPESGIVFFDTSNGIKRIELHKGGNTKPKVMKEI
jgi:hypothetical protein